MRLVAAATRTTQNTDDAEAWACAGAAVLDAIVARGRGGAEAVEDAAAELESGSGRLPAGGRREEIAGLLRRVLALRGEPHADVVTELGRNCHMPNAALTPIHAALHQEWRLERLDGPGPGALEHASVEVRRAAYVAGIRGALAAGGCCASRAGFAGALLGALLGADAVPPEWRGKCATAGDAAAAFEHISAARGRAA